MENPSGGETLQPPPKGARIGIIFNLKKGAAGPVEDMEAEYDNIDTVYAIQAALERAGLTALLFEAGPALADQLRDVKPDMAFNIAEGFSGRGREAQIPALLNILGIPFTGSDETTLCIALDKALTKRLVSSFHVRTPHYALLTPGQPIHAAGLTFPVIVKPNAEGSSKGISDISVVNSPAELKAVVGRSFELYHEDMLAEEYIHGREFTVGLLGNGKETKVFHPMEIIYRRPTQGDYAVYSYGVKKDYQNCVDYQCPADLTPQQEADMVKAARKVYDLLGCRDFGRADFRMSPDGRIWFIEINPLPGLAPGYSDYPMLAGFCGTDYDELVLSVLKAGAQRCGVTLFE